MKGMRADLIPLLERDVLTIQNEARLVFEFGTLLLEYTKAVPPRLNVVGVLGPPPIAAPVNGLRQVVLCEVGLGKSRPYHEAKKPRLLRRVDEEGRFQRRHKVFGMTEEQYSEVAPRLFQYLQKLVEEATARWKCGIENPFRVPYGEQRIVRREGACYESVKYMPKQLSLRFSISLDDKFLVRDIFWAELRANKDLENTLRGLAGFTYITLSRYVGRHQRKARTRRNPRPLRELWGGKVLRESFARFLPHVLVELVDRYLPERLRGGKRNILWERVAELIGWDFEERWEQRMASLALPNPERRLGNSQIRVIAINHDHLVFELLASKQPKRF